MRKSVWLFLSALTLSTASMVVACGDDDNPVNPNPTGDAGADTGASSSGDSGSDAGCTFAGFVTNLINTQTNGTATPSAELGDQCTPSTSQDDFKPLFP